MEGLLQLMTSLGVSAPAGFNAYLALLLVGLGARANWVSLNAPYDFLQNTPVLAVLAVLLTVEIVADKVPAMDSVNDLVGTVVRPISGALLFAGTNQIITDELPLLSLLAGGAAAGGIHAFKAATRPVWTISTGGMANPVVSVFEDLLAGTTVILAMLLPVLAIIVLLLALGIVGFFLSRLRRRLGPQARVAR